jgi:3-dehydroquinate dehydratase / shikimate dehydrogenase
VAAAQKLGRQAKAKAIKRGDLKKLSFDVIINATPVGMGDVKASPLNEKEIKAKFVMDLVYGEGETRFLLLARAQGTSVIPGWEMFVHQGARQFEIWTGKPAPISEMQNEVQSALSARARNGNNHRKK